MKNKFQITTTKLAYIAGTSLLLMATIAGFAYGYAFQNIYVADNAKVTMQNINNSAILFQAFFFSFVIILVLDLIVTGSLYLYFKPVDRVLSFSSSFFRLCYTIILGIALIKIFTVLQQANDLNQNEIMTMYNIKSFLDIWSMGLILFGIHLLFLSILVLKSDFMPNFLGFLILIAAICYILTNVANQLVTNYDIYKGTVDSILGLPMAMGELGIALWLVLKGNKIKQI